ncbi:MAG: hypothetical protein ACHQ0J_05615 [Candidatus Dormibacterales bacterium]
MAELSDFRLGADVVARDGERAGTLVSVLVDRDGLVPRAVVVQDESSTVGKLLAAERLFITDEVMVPIASVVSATRDLVTLALSRADLRSLPPYLSYRFNPVSLEASVLREGEVLGGALGLPNSEQVANKPASEIEIEKSENVMLGQTGHRLGRVQDVLFDQGAMIGVVIRPDGFFKQDVVLPARFIARSDDMALFARLDESDIAHLEPFRENK